ncbi:anti-sigma factor [Pedobacter polaris]|uniref:Anti-sigma factor n=1 Tax=Pedobacter polaris TaxID=2571273 RepID=A0A4U1CU35_9SPHI|nr:anti-sigma factor [Pedobacter polaris]TKC12096.1 anti-sigma factor [Pedobacter polaris]
MEEVKAYIESGILELYVLGQLSAPECDEVEAMAAKHPEVRTEITAIELAMEAYALENAITPSAKLGDKILKEISGEEIISDPRIIPLYQDANYSKIKALRLALVACVALLAICAAALFSVYTQLNTANEQIASLSTSNDQFARTVNKLEFDKAGMENRIAMTETDEWMTVKLAGVANSPKAKMLVYWNKNNKSILINHSAMELPKTDKTHEYQLWALVNGKPVSLGVFGENAKEAVQQMVTIEKAQAFAVTIEPVGGSVNPTMEKMVVMGEVAI